MWRNSMDWLYKEIFSSNRTLLIAFCVAATVLWIAGVLSYRWKSSSAFFALLSITVGGVLLAFVCGGVSITKTAPFFALLAIVVGITYLIFFLCYRLWLKAKAKREEREKSVRALRYTLPQKDNTFIRARLNTTLNETVGEEKAEALELRFAYANALLAKLRSEKLSVTEKLETEELGKVLALYTQKDKYCGEDVRLLGEAFSKVLKLAAKYGV